MCIPFLQKPAMAPITETYKISRDDYIAALARYGITPLSAGDPLDPFLTIQSKAELDRVAPALVYPANWYIENLWDCENFGMQAANDAGRLLYFSAVLCTGFMELGYHGFVLAMDTDKNVWLLEPNAGYPWAGRWFAPTLTFDKPLQDSMYIPKKVLL